MQKADFKSIVIDPYIVEEFLGSKDSESHRFKSRAPIELPSLNPEGPVEQVEDPDAVTLDFAREWVKKGASVNPVRSEGCETYEDEAVLDTIPETPDTNVHVLRNADITLGDTHFVAVVEDTEPEICLFCLADRTALCPYCDVGDNEAEEVHKCVVEFSECGHGVHKHCMDNWRSQGTCPLCKQKWSTKSYSHCLYDPSTLEVQY